MVVETKMVVCEVWVVVVLMGKEHKGRSKVLEILFLDLIMVREVYSYV